MLEDIVHGDSEQKKNPGHWKLWELQDYFHCLQRYRFSISDVKQTLS